MQFLVVKVSNFDQKFTEVSGGPIDHKSSIFGLGDGLAPMNTIDKMNEASHYLR